MNKIAQYRILEKTAIEYVDTMNNPIVPIVQTFRGIQDDPKKVKLKKKIPGLAATGAALGAGYAYLGSKLREAHWGRYLDTIKHRMGNETNELWRGKIRKGEALDIMKKVPKSYHIKNVLRGAGKGAMLFTVPYLVGRAISSPNIKKMFKQIKNKK